MLLILSLGSLTSQAATVATIEVWAGSFAGNPANTFDRLSTSGGFGPFGNRIGLASTVSAAREIAGTSKASIWTISEAGTLTVSYFLDNSVSADFQPGIQGLYDASDGIATTAAGVRLALNGFVGLSGVSATTTPDPHPESLNTGSNPAVWFTTTYVIDQGSPAIGKAVAVGFHSSWNGRGGYIFGNDAEGTNEVVLDFVPIPEPSVALIGTLGLLGLLRRRR